MSIHRWLRLIPGRRQWLLFAGIAALIVFAFGFVDLAMTRQALQGRHVRAAAKVERLQEQNFRLQQDLDRKQEGQHLPDQAFQYYGQAPRGVGVIVVEPEPVPQVTPNAAQTAERRPFWVDLWERLTRP